MPAHRFTAPIAAHGALVLKLSNGVPAPVPTFTYYAAAGPGSVLAGGATPRVVNGTATVVGFVGNGGTLTLTGIDGGGVGRDDAAHGGLHQCRCYLLQHGVLELPQRVLQRERRAGGAGADAALWAGA